MNTGGVFGGGAAGPFVTNLDANDVLLNLPTVPQWVVDIAAGAGDALSFRLTTKARERMGTNGEVNQCSGAYAAGALSPLIYGVGRLGYAAAAKAIPLVYGAVATEESALAAYSARNTLKSVFNLGKEPLRSKTWEQLVSEKNGDWARIIRSAGKTSPAFNNSGAVTVGGVITAITGRSCQ